MSEDVYRLDWLREARYAINDALKDAERMPHPSMRGPEVKLIQDMAIAINGLLAIAQHAEEQRDIPALMPSPRP